MSSTEETGTYLSHWRLMKRILVATDELTFVHVVPTVEFVPTAGVDDVHGALPHQPAERDHALLRDAASLAAEQGVTATTVLLGGSTA